MENDKLTKILEAAKAHFTEKGFAEAKVSDIAKAAGVSTGTIYNYFNNKRELFDSLGLPELETLRPEYEQKRHDILQNALKLFGQKGYTRTTMDDIAIQLGVSKAALYQYFSSKEEIFTSLVQESDIRSLLVNLTKKNTNSDYISSIQEVGFEFLSMYSEPDKLNLLRAIICESHQFPELGQLIYKGTIDDAHSKVAKYLENSEGLREINSKFAARAFLGMLLSFVVVDKLINTSDDEFTQTEIVSGVVDIFLNGVKLKGRD